MFKSFYAVIVIFVIFGAVTEAQPPNCVPVLTILGRSERVCQRNCAPRQPANECFRPGSVLAVRLCPPVLCCRDINNQCIPVVRIGK